MGLRTMSLIKPFLCTNQWNDLPLALHIPKTELIHILGDARQATVSDLNGMVLDTSLLQQFVREQEQLGPEFSVLRCLRTSVRARNHDWRSRNGWSHQPVSTNVSTRVFYDGGNGFEGNISTTRRSNCLIAHTHRGWVGHSVEDVEEAVGGVLADIGAACRRTIVEASSSAV